LLTNTPKQTKTDTRIQIAREWVFTNIYYLTNTNIPKTPKFKIIIIINQNKHNKISIIIKNILLFLKYLINL